MEWAAIRKIERKVKFLEEFRRSWACGCVAVHVVNDEWLPFKVCREHRRPRAVTRLGKE